MSPFPPRWLVLCMFLAFSSLSSTNRGNHFSRFARSRNIACVQRGYALDDEGCAIYTLDHSVPFSCLGDTSTVVRRRHASAFCGLKRWCSLLSAMGDLRGFQIPIFLFLKWEIPVQNLMYGGGSQTFNLCTLSPVKPLGSCTRWSVSSSRLFDVFSCLPGPQLLPPCTPPPCTPSTPPTIPLMHTAASLSPEYRKE